MKEKITFVNTIMIAIMKGIMFERNIHRAVFAERCGKTLSTWSEIEKGESPISLELFCKICNALCIKPSYIMSVLEYYVGFVQKNGYIVLEEIQNEQPDTLLERLNEYYSLEETKRLNNYSYNLIYSNTYETLIYVDFAFSYAIQNIYA